MTVADITPFFIQATTHVLSAVSGITPEAGTPYITKERQTQADVSAIVGITGDMVGTMALSFSQACAIAVVKGMLGDAVEDILADTRDAVGEITNMISGQARAALSKNGPTLQGSTPSLVFGKCHRLSFPGQTAIVVVPFRTRHGEFMLEFCIQ